jgi:hypothetical protein
LGLGRAMGGKRQIDAEELVRWAAADELPKKRRRLFKVPDFRALVGQDAELVGEWVAPASYPSVSAGFAAGLSGSSIAAKSFLLGEPDDDALIVENTIGKLKDAALAVDPFAILADIGFAVDAAAAIAAAGKNVVGLILAHGATRSRPDCDHAFRAVRRVAASNGQAAVFLASEVRMPAIDGSVIAIPAEIRTERLRGGLYPKGAYCRIEFDPDPDEIVADRARYAVWRAGLSALALALAGQLARFEPVEPEAPLYPWIKETGS